MPSRRDLLGTSAALAGSVLAGCLSGEASSSTADCATGAVRHGDGDLLDGGATAGVEDGTVYLRVPFSVDEMESGGVDRLRLYDASGDLEHEIPVAPGDADVAPEKLGQGDGQLYYDQSLGDRPLHGRYRVVALDAEGEELDSVTVEFNCFAEGAESA